jgi:hypothetical protein
MCSRGVVEAVHSLLDHDLAGVHARSWLDNAQDVMWFVNAGAPEALERHGWTFRAWPDGRCMIERKVDDDVPLPVRWLADCCSEGGEMTLAEAAGSYRAWLIGWRTANGHLYGKDQQKHRLASPPRKLDGDGKRLLRRLGYRTTRKCGPTRFLGISLKPETPPARPPVADDGGSVVQALNAVADMVGDLRALDVAYLRLSGERGNLCRRCGVMTRHAEQHVECPDVGARYAAPVTTEWMPGMGGLAEEAVGDD